MSIQSINPATEEIIKTFTELSDDEIKNKISKAEQAFVSWKNTDINERKQRMLVLSAILKKESKAIGTILTQEMGKPIKQAIAEVEKCAWVCEYYANEAENILREEVIQSDASQSYVRFDPLGIIFAVMPWNFAFWQVMRFAAPAVMAGNVGLLKHASNVPQSAEMIEQLFLKAGFPEGVFQNLLISSRKVEQVIRDPRVKAVTLTGSEAAGRQVAMQAGDEIKKSVLELGGSDPFIILEDADLAQACDMAVNARLQNNGQSCIAAKRFIMVQKYAQQFTEMYKAKYASLKIGDPMDETVDIGPLATASIRDDIEKQVNTSVRQGAKIIIGGKRVGEKGFFYEPTILTDVKKGMLAYEEELFGPVATIIVVQDEEEAIHVANDTKFGLGASLWTQNTDRAKELAKRIDAGAVFINGMVKSDPRLPFGGVKKSGYGRELSYYGMKEFVNIKTVWVK